MFITEKHRRNFRHLCTSTVHKKFTRKLSYVTARGLPPAAYPVRKEGKGYPPPPPPESHKGETREGTWERTWRKHYLPVVPRTRAVIRWYLYQNFMLIFIESFARYIAQNIKSVHGNLFMYCRRITRWSTELVWLHRDPRDRRDSLNTSYSTSGRTEPTCLHYSRLNRSVTVTSLCSSFLSNCLSLPTSYLVDLLLLGF